MAERTNNWFVYVALRPRGCGIGLSIYHCFWLKRVAVSLNAYKNMVSLLTCEKKSWCLSHASSVPPSEKSVQIASEIDEKSFPWNYNSLLLWAMSLWQCTFHCFKCCYCWSPRESTAACKKGKCSLKRQKGSQGKEYAERGDSEAENRRQNAKRWIKICRRGYGIQGCRQRSSREVIRGPGRDKLKGQGSVGPEEGEASLQVQKWTHRCQRHIGHQSLEILC